jgi:TonB family protein
MAPFVLSITSGVPAVPVLKAGSAWPAALGAAWLFGAAACAVLFGARQLRFASAIRKGSSALVGKTPVIRATGRDMGPALVGRAIVMPADFEVRFTATEQAAIIAHESQHMARGDVIANAGVAAIQCLCWFNPLVHLAARMMRFDQELACDAAVIAQRPDLRRPYAEALLKTQTIAVVPPLGCAWRARGFPALRDRIQMLKQGSPSAPRRASGALLLVVLASGGGYAAWAAAPAQKPSIAAPVWSSKPTGADLARLYPAQARAQGLGGMAVIQCDVTTAGALSGCAVVSETPRGAGFAGATLQMAPLFRMKPKSIDGKPVAGGIVRIPVKYMVPPAVKAQP